jgi:hypothetical protein
LTIDALARATPLEVTRGEVYGDIETQEVRNFFLIQKLAQGIEHLLISAG